MHTSLRKSINHLYDVFGKYKAGLATTAKPHYRHELVRGSKVIYYKPLRELTQDDLDLYAGEAMMMWGTVADFKHYLPRILELTAALKEPGVDVFLYKLEYAEWKNWPREEVNAIEAFMYAFFAELLEGYERDSHVLSMYFDSILFTCCYPEKMLKIWQEDHRSSLSLGLALYIQEFEKELFNLNVKLHCIEDNEANNTRRQLIKDWFLADHTIKRLQGIVDRNEDHELVFNASWALGILEKYLP